MTIPQTIDDIMEYIHANTSNGDWHIDKFGLIRLTDASCPICWLGSKVGKNPLGLIIDENAIARNMELGVSVYKPIAWAADNSPLAVPGIRERLLKACRLEETK